jgi:MraZ protein
MLLTGTFLRSMDEKQRIALPKRVREALEADQSAALFLTPGTDESLALYTEETLKGWAARLAAASPTRQDVRAFNRLFYAQAEQVELDDQGRFRVPAGLVKLAGLAREVALVGVQDHLEIWDRTRWESYLAGKSADYDRIAEQAFGNDAGPSS